ncbi:MAG: hypothetical protein PHT32_08205, partial [Candidatus Omnitrophica bacterium]|nr:hypothetical protein [Candidatus Omnitrophota bacterium]
LLAERAIVSKTAATRADIETYTYVADTIAKAVASFASSAREVTQKGYEAAVHKLDSEKKASEAIGVTEVDGKTLTEAYDAKKKELDEKLDAAKKAYDGLITGSSLTKLKSDAKAVSDKIYSITGGSYCVVRDGISTKSISAYIGGVAASALAKGRQIMWGAIDKINASGNFGSSKKLALAVATAQKAEKVYNARDALYDAIAAIDDALYAAIDAAWSWYEKTVTTETRSQSYYIPYSTYPGGYSTGLNYEKDSFTDLVQTRSLTRTGWTSAKYTWHYTDSGNSSYSYTEHITTCTPQGNITIADLLYSGTSSYCNETWSVDGDKIFHVIKENISDDNKWAYNSTDGFHQVPSHTYSKIETYSIQIAPIPPSIPPGGLQGQYFIDYTTTYKEDGTGTTSAQPHIYGSLPDPSSLGYSGLKFTFDYAPPGTYNYEYPPWTVSSLDPNKTTTTTSGTTTTTTTESSIDRIESYLAMRGQIGAINSAFSICTAVVGGSYFEYYEDTSNNAYTIRSRSINVGTGSATTEYNDAVAAIEAATPSVDTAMAAADRSAKVSRAASAYSAAVETARTTKDTATKAAKVGYANTALSYVDTLKKIDTAAAETRDSLLDSVGVQYYGTVFQYLKNTAFAMMDTTSFNETWNRLTSEAQKATTALVSAVGDASSALVTTVNNYAGSCYDSLASLVDAWRDDLASFEAGAGADDDGEIIAGLGGEDGDDGDAGGEPSAGASYETATDEEIMSLIMDAMPALIRSAIEWYNSRVRQAQDAYNSAIGKLFEAALEAVNQINQRMLSAVAWFLNEVATLQAQIETYVADILKAYYSVHTAITGKYLETEDFEKWLAEAVEWEKADFDYQTGITPNLQAAQMVVDSRGIFDFGDITGQNFGEDLTWDRLLVAAQTTMDYSTMWATLPDGLITGFDVDMDAPWKDGAESTAYLLEKVKTGSGSDDYVLVKDITRATADSDTAYLDALIALSGNAFSSTTSGVSLTSMLVGSYYSSGFGTWTGGMKYLPNTMTGAPMSATGSFYSIFSAPADSITDQRVDGAIKYYDQNLETATALWQLAGGYLDDGMPVFESLVESRLIT